MTRSTDSTRISPTSTLLAALLSASALTCGGDAASDDTATVTATSSASETSSTSAGPDEPTGAPDSDPSSASDESGSSSGGPALCAPTCAAPTSAVKLAPLDCMASGWTAGDASIPSLPFHQPSAQPADLDQIVTSGLPASNRYQVAFGWNGPAPIVPVGSWRVDEFTKASVPDPVADWQRGQVDAYGQSATHVRGTQVGLWANSMDTGGMFYAGSASLNTGCWYQSPPFARLFPTAGHALDVAFLASVPTDASTGNAHGQAYFQLIAIDQSGNCGEHCGFSFAVGFYSKFPGNAADTGVIGDATGTLGTLPLAGAGLDAPQWIQRMPDSIGYQTTTFGLAPIHFRVRPADLLAIRDAVAVFSAPYAALSTDPTDYVVSLLNVNGETYDPCKDETHIATCSGIDYAQLAWTVQDFHVTSFVDHQSAGGPAAIAAPNGTGAVVVHRTADGKLDTFTDRSDTGAFTHASLVASGVAGPPATLAASDDAPATALYRDDLGHIHLRALDGSASDIDVHALSGAPPSASDPRGFVAPDRARRIVYRDAAGVVRSLVETGTAWQEDDLAAVVDGLPPSDGAPMGYAAECGWHLVYRDLDRRIRLVDVGPDGATTTDTAEIPGALEHAYSDPQGFAGPDGAAHVVYRDITGNIHELVHTDGVWTHSEISTLAGATPAIGSPSGQLAGCASRIAYLDVNYQVHLMTYADGAWTDRSFADVRGATQSTDDPVLFTDAQDVVRIAYRGVDGRLRELLEADTGWLAREM